MKKESNMKEVYREKRGLRTFYQEFMRSALWS